MTSDAFRQPEPAPDDRGDLVTFDLVLRWCTGGFAAFTALGLVLGVMVVTGSLPVSVPATPDEPYTFVFGTGPLDELESTAPAVAVVDGDIRARINLPIGEESRHIGSAPDVRFQANVTREDRDTRVVLMAAAALAVAAAWIVLMALRRLVAAERAGRPFDEAGRRRLLRIATVIAAVPVADMGLTWLLNRTLEVEPAMSVVRFIPGTLPWFFLAAAVAALAQAGTRREATKAAV